MISSGARECLSWLENWDKVRISDAKKNQIKLLVDGQNFIFFFEYHGKIYGSGETSRVIFARMKHPTQDEPESFDKDSSFSAFNLSGAIQGQPSQQIFQAKDLLEIKVISDKDKVCEILAKQVEEIAPERLTQIMKIAFKDMKSNPQSIIDQDK